MFRGMSLVPGGKRLRYPGGGRIELQRGADQAEGSRLRAAFADRGNEWLRGLPVQSATGGGVNTISCQPEHPVQERVEFLKCACVRDKEVTAIGENRKDGAEN